MSITKRVALITGASKGIGKAIALQLAKCGYDLFIVGRDTEALDNIRVEVETLERQCEYMSIDLSDEESPLAVISRVVKVYGQLDVVVNNAGMAISASVPDTSIATWNKIFAVNARAPFFICKAAIPYLKESVKAIIINIGSVVDFKGYAEQGAYASSKHALAGFTKVLAKEVQADGIRVHLISPGGVNTEMVQEMRPDIDTTQLIQASEIAELVEFIVTRNGQGTIDHFYIRRQSGLAFD